MDKILVIDDDPNILKVIRMRLEAKGYQIAASLEGEQAVETAKGEAFDLALVDLKLNGKNGIEVMEDLHHINPEMPIIILTAHGSIESAVDAMKKGAHSYLTKPFDYHELLVQIENCLERSRLLKEVKRLRGMVKKQYGFENIVGKSEKMLRVLEQLSQIAESDSIVFIEGESGTGKELIAKHLHVASLRKEGPFVAINCAAIPETLLESELFGYEKGAFTGADRRKRGLFAQAHGGTFFLDEISEMSLAMQAKLLRVLQEKEVHPLGGEKTIQVDARIIVASNKNLEDEVALGRFRKDLFYRVHVIVVTLPPLRERKEDIPLLAKHFLGKFAETMKKEITGLTPTALQKLVLHDWPGNVRELENTIESAVALASHDLITEDLILPTQKPQDESLQSLKDAKEGFEKNYLIRLLQITAGNVSQAAKLAGKYRADLYELLRKHNLEPAAFRERDE